MHLRHWLTWKRSKQLFPAWATATFPLVLTLLASTVITVPIPWQDSNPRGLLLIGGVVILVICAGIYWLTHSAAEVLFYPPLHKRRWVSASAISLMATGILVTYLAYLCFLVPLNNPVIPYSANIVLGLVLAFSYALFLGGWKTRTLREDRDPVSKSEVAREIRDSLHNLRSTDPNFGDTEKLISGLRTLIEQYESEPLMNQDDSPEIIRMWCDECSKSNSLASRLRMVPQTGKKPTSDRTEEQFARFREVENDLHTMGIIDSVSEE